MLNLALYVATILTIVRIKPLLGAAAILSSKEANGSGLQLAPFFGVEMPPLRFALIRVHTHSAPCFPSTNMGSARLGSAFVTIKLRHYRHFTWAEPADGGPMRRVAKTVTIILPTIMH